MADVTGGTGALDAHIGVARQNGFRLDLDLHIEPGTTTALLGPNGAGKTTAVWALTGVVPLDWGRISLGDLVFDDPSSNRFVGPEERGIGVVFQDLLLFPHLNIVENVAFGALRRRGRRAALEAARLLLDRLGLAVLARLRPHELSGGQAQQVALARALAADPCLLLLDEPLSALDVSNRSVVRRLLAEHLSAFPGPRMIITHDPTEAFLLADRVVILEGGRQTQTGTPDEIRSHPRTPYAADLAGLNLLGGTAENGRVALDAGPNLQIGDTAITGKVLVIVHPRAIAIHKTAPGGSPRNSWSTRVARIERIDGWTRIQFDAPLPLTAEITRASEEDLGLEVGTQIWAAVKAAELRVQPD